MNLVLRVPRVDEEQEFLNADHATSPDTPYFIFNYEDGMPFTDYLTSLQQHARGEKVAEGFVPATFLFAFVENRIVGRVSIRHRLNGFLEKIGGHIGYVVVPEFRRRGYATEILRQSIEIARHRLEIGRLLITCDDSNVGSIRTIERNGGVLENILTGPEFPTAKRRSIHIDSFNLAAQFNGGPQW
jgi:predicted acetyltransferase